MNYSPAPVSKDRKVLRRIDFGAARTSVTGVLAALAVYALIAWAGRLYQDFRGLALGLGLMVIVISAYRLLIVARFDTLYASGPARWRTLFGIGLLAHACVWGAIFGSVTVLHGVGFNFFAVALYNIGVTTGLSGAWMASLRSRQVYIALMFVPAIVALAATDVPQGWLLALLLAIYAGYLYRMFASLHDTFWHALARVRRPAASAPAGLPRSGQDIQLSLVYRLAQELRTPMNSMLGMLALLDETELTDEQKEYHQVAAQSGRLSLSLIDDVLDYSRILTGRIVLNPDFFDVREALEQALDAYGHIAESKGVELTAVLKHDLPRRVRGDRERIMQVLNNLLSNAIKFSEQGEIRLEVDFQGDNDGDGLLQLRVTDQGVGMAPEQATSLFDDPFQAPEVDNPAARRGGFGLLVCKGLVDAMAGRIGVESTPGEGSCFWFNLPMQAQPDMSDRTDLRRVLRDQHLLVVGAASGTAAMLAEEMQALDANSEVIDDYDAVLAVLREGQREGQRQLLYLDTWARREAALNLCRAVAADPALAAVQVILGVSVDERSQPSVQKLVREQGLPVLTRPLHRRALRLLLSQLYGLDDPLATELQFAEFDDQAQRKDYRLLLVENDHASELVLRGMLAKLGYPLKSVSDGEAALALMQQEAFDLVLLDCMLPGMDGFAVASAIRERERAEASPQQVALDTLPRVPVIGVSADIMGGAQARCFAAGMDDVLGKPLQLDQLETVLRHWLPATPSQKEKQ